MESVGSVILKTNVESISFLRMDKPVTLFACVMFALSLNVIIRSGVTAVAGSQISSRVHPVVRSSAHKTKKQTNLTCFNFIFFLKVQHFLRDVFAETYLRVVLGLLCKLRS